ncbi:MAG: ribonuclease D [Candidatus Obscuribacter sp.]|nr:ribonuclease D [Candidatus Melainabacteria bacterium]MDX1990453.1 ribonuclease D [Candidatus Obscuribacter sp.]
MTNEKTNEKTSAREMHGKLIDAQEDLKEMLQSIESCGIFGIDLEFIPEKSYFPLICLVQVAVGERVFLVDPIKVQNLDDLWRYVADPGYIKVLHAGSQDLAIVNQRSGFIPKRIFDTQIAAGFLGLGYPAGYGKLLHALFDLTLSKTESFTDWSLRPLTASQIDYAIDDALHLLPLYQRLEERLKERGRLDWVLEECKLYEQESYYQKETGREFMRIKGAQGLSRRKLAVLQAICLWRDQEARRIDKPPRFVLSDNIILELAKKPPTTPGDISRIRGIKDGQLSGYGKHIIRVVAEALALKEADCPQWPAGRAPSKADVLIADVLYTVLKVRSQEIEIAPELIATRDELQRFVRQDKGQLEKEEEESALTSGWRHKLAGSELHAILSGAPLTVTVTSTSHNPISIKLEN